MPSLHPDPTSAKEEEKKEKEEDMTQVRREWANMAQTSLDLLARPTPPQPAPHVQPDRPALTASSTLFETHLRPGSEERAQLPQTNARTHARTHLQRALVLSPPLSASCSPCSFSAAPFRSCLTHRRRPDPSSIYWRRGRPTPSPLSARERPIEKRTVPLAALFAAFGARIERVLASCARPTDTFARTPCCKHPL